MGIDIVVPLQDTASGNKYIVAAADHFSKWSEAAVCEVLQKGRVHLKNLNTGQKLNNVYQGSNRKVYDSQATTDEDVSTPLPGKRKTENPDETESKRFKPEADILDTKTTKDPTDSPKSSVGTPERHFNPISVSERNCLKVKFDYPKSSILGGRNT